MNEKRIDSSLESQLLIDNIGLIVAQARKFKETSVTDIDDYKQAGALALLRAIRRYDPKMGASLATFSWKSIYREIYREANRYRQHSSLITDVGYDSNESFSDYLPDLTEEQSQILWLRLCGYSLEEIGKQFSQTKQTINNKITVITSIIRHCNEKTKATVGQ